MPRIRPSSRLGTTTTAVPAVPILGLALPLLPPPRPLRLRRQILARPRLPAQRQPRRRNRKKDGRLHCARACSSNSANSCVLQVEHPLPMGDHVDRSGHRLQRARSRRCLAQASLRRQATWPISWGYRGLQHRRQCHAWRTGPSTLGCVFSSESIRCQQLPNRYCAQGDSGDGQSDQAAEAGAFVGGCGDSPGLATLISFTILFLSDVFVLLGLFW